MRISTSIVLLSLAAALATGMTRFAAAQEFGACGPCQGQEGCGYSDAAEQGPCGEERQPIFQGLFGDFECAHWDFTADAVALQRSTTRRQPLFVNGNGATLLDSQNMNFPVEMGFHVAAVRHGPCGWDVEAGYFQVDGWAANGNVPGASIMVTDVSGGNFFVDDAVARYTSQFHIGELNLRREWFDGLTLLAGFRAGELDELYSGYGIGSRVPVPISVNVNTYNHLYGFQLGADWEFYNMGGPLRISAMCKSGIYANYAIQTMRQIEGTATDDTLEARRRQATFMGEAGLTATYEITCHLSFRATAQAVWIEGVALAPEQISANDFTAGAAGIDTHGGIFYYGGGAGFEYKF